MKFTLEIELGNEGMQTYHNVSGALIGTRDSLRDEWVIGVRPIVGHYRDGRMAELNLAEGQLKYYRNAIQSLRKQLVELEAVNG